MADRLRGGVEDDGGGEGDGLRGWLGMLSLPLGMVVVILFWETLLDIAVRVMAEFGVGFWVALGIVLFVLFAGIDLLLSP